MTDDGKVCLAYNFEVYKIISIFALLKKSQDLMIFVTLDNGIL